MSLQNIIDKSQKIEIDRRKIVGQTISRSQRIKTAERSTAQPWKFKITPPGALKWDQSRAFIEVIDLNDRVGEYQISLSNTAGMSYVTEYQGDLNSTQTNSITIGSAGTNTMVLTTLPSIGATITSQSQNITAQSFSTATSATYNRALSVSRTDFLISNTEYQANYSRIGVGDTVTATTYITSGQTITGITYNYITLAGTGYTRIEMSAAPNVNTPQAISNGSDNLTVTVRRIETVSSSSYILRRGDFIQPANSRYPYSVTEDVVRGVNTTTNVTLNRNIITSEGIALSGQTILVGNSCTWRVVVSGLPTYQLIPGRLVQYTGDFEIVEKIV